MNKTRYPQYFHTLALVSLLGLSVFTSCMSDNPDGPREGVPVTVSISAGAEGATSYNAPATRTENAGDPVDSTIGSVRVLGFRVSDGTLAFNSVIENPGRQTSSFIGLTGRYTLVFIANENSDPVLAGELDALDPAAADVFTLEDLRDKSFSVEAFDVAKNIPMVKIVNNASITTTGAAGDPAPGTTNLGDPLRVEMERLGVRFDLEMTLSAAQFDSWYNVSAPAKTIHFDGVPDRVYLTPRDNTATTVTRSVTLGSIGNPVAVDGKKSVTVNRAVILPEKHFTLSTDAAKGVDIRILAGPNTWSGKIAVAQGAGKRYSLPRNSYLRVVATSGRDTVGFNAIDIPDWNDAPIDAAASGARFNVTVVSASGGSAMANLTRARAGVSVTLVAVPEPGKRLSGWAVTYTEARQEKTITTTPMTGQPSIATFTMPAANVQVTPSFGEATVYTVTVHPPTDAGGTAVGIGSASPHQAEPGQRVTLTATSNNLDYGTFKEWKISLADGTDVTARYLTGTDDASAPTVNPATIIMGDRDLVATPVYAPGVVKMEVQYVTIELDGTRTSLSTPHSTLTPIANTTTGATVENGTKALPGGAGVPVGTAVAYSLSWDTYAYTLEVVDIYGGGHVWNEADITRYHADDTYTNMAFTMLPSVDTGGGAIKGGRVMVIYLKKIPLYKAQMNIGEGLTVADSDGEYTGNYHGNWAWTGNGIHAGEHLSYRVTGVASGWWFDGWSATDKNGNAIAFATNEPNAYGGDRNMWFNMPEGGVKLYANSRPAYRVLANSNLPDYWPAFSDYRLWEGGLPADPNWWHYVEAEATRQYNGQTWYFTHFTWDGGSTQDNPYWFTVPVGGRTYTAHYMLYKPNPVGEVAVTGDDGKGNQITTIWAKTNLADDGVFADSETTVGKLYKWGVDGSALGNGVNTWPDDKNPCPPGWRVPKYMEFNALLRAAGDLGFGPGTKPPGSNHVYNMNGQWGTMHAGVFMPNTNINAANGGGLYWMYESMCMIFSTDNSYDQYANFHSQANANNIPWWTYPVRCVRSAQ